VNPLVEGSSPSGPTTSHKNHSLMSLRPGDHSPLVSHRNPLVCHMAGGIVGHESTDRTASSDVTRFESRRGHQCCFNTVALLLLIPRSAVRARPGEPYLDIQ
jgi:hypothetical protein